MTIKINASLPVGNTPPFYEKYQNELKPQPVMLRMDEGGNVDIYISSIIGSGAPEAEWNNRHLTWRLSPELSENQVKELLLDQDVIDLLNRIHESHMVEWDGSIYRGRYDEDLSIELQRLLDDRYNSHPEAQVWDAHEWLFGQGQPLEDAWLPNEALEAAAKRLKEEAEFEGVILEGDIHQQLINKLLDKDPEELTGEHLNAYYALSSDDEVLAP